MRSGPGEWNRSVVALLVAEFTSVAAALAGVTALGKQIYDLTHRAFDLGLLGLAEFAPAALLVLVTGSVADRFRRERVSAASLVGEAASASGLAWYASTRPTAVLPIFALVIAFGVARAFLAPALRALPSEVVAPERLAWLVARFNVTGEAGLILGPVLGGVLYAIDPVAPYVAMAVLVAVGTAAVVLVRGHRPADDASEPDRAIAMTFVGEVHPEIGHEAPAAPPGPGLHDALEGLRFIRRQPVLLGAISLDLFAVLFGGAVALLPAIAEDRLHVGSVGLGWLRAAGGIGAAMTTLVLTRHPVTRRVGRTLLVVVATFGIGTIVLGTTRSFVVAFFAMAVLTGADAVSVFIRSTLVPLVTPRSKRGRVLAVENVFIGASNELGAFESGVVGQLIGSSGAIVLGGVATLVVAGTWWVAFPALRDVDRFPEPSS